jgi:hypothetical protein
MKVMQQKEGKFAMVMQEAYKAYVADKEKIPENANVLDLAMKLCNYEITRRKNIEKGIASTQPNLISGLDVPANSGEKQSPFIPGLTKRRSMNTKTVTSVILSTSLPTLTSSTANIPSGVTAPSTPTVPKPATVNPAKFINPLSQVRLIIFTFLCTLKLKYILHSS